MAKEAWSDRKLQLFSTFAETISLIKGGSELSDEEVAEAEGLYDYMPEEWLDSLEENPEETTTQYLQAIQEQYASQDADYGSPELARKGTNLKKLSKMKKRGKVGKKCSCGCTMTTKKAEGGKVFETCSCCGKKMQTGGVTPAPKAFNYQSKKTTTGKTTASSNTPAPKPFKYKSSQAGGTVNRKTLGGNPYIIAADKNKEKKKKKDVSSTAAQSTVEKVNARSMERTKKKKALTKQMGGTTPKPKYKKGPKIAKGKTRNGWTKWQA